MHPDTRRPPRTARPWLPSFDTCACPWPSCSDWPLWPAAVEEAVVIGKALSAEGTSLVAYLTVASSHDVPTQQQLRDHLAALLPSYMVPSILMQMDALPRGAGHKIDVGALPEPQQTSVTEDSAQDAVVGSGGRLAQIWCEVLEVDSFDPDANFFELGGSSASLTVCIVRMEEEFGRRIAPGEFFTRSFRQLTALLETSE